MFKQSGGKYATLLSLYLAQSIPMSFFSTVMPVIMREEAYSLTDIGLIQLIKIPWIIKFLWAPFVDSTGKTTTGHRKWIIGSEIFYAIIILSISFLNFNLDFGLIIILMLIAFTASATQDIATDAFAILVLKKEERSTGNSIQAAGSFLGTLTGSGVLLIIYHYLGWQYLLVGLAGFVVLALLPLMFYKAKHATPKSENVKPISMKDIGLFFKAPGNMRRVALLAVFYSRIIGVLTMLKPYLVDLGYNKAEIGILSGVHGAAFGAAAAIVAGRILKKHGKRKCLRVFASIGFLASTYFFLMTQIEPAKYMIIFGIALLWSAYGMSSVVIYTISMDNVREGREGTDFTLQIVITHLSSLIIAVSSGKIANSIGYEGLFMIEVMIGLLVLISIGKLYKEHKSLADETRKETDR